MRRRGPLALTIRRVGGRCAHDGEENTLKTVPGPIARILPTRNCVYSSSIFYTNGGGGANWQQRVANESVQADSRVGKIQSPQGPVGDVLEDTPSVDKSNRMLTVTGTVWKKEE